MNNENVVDANEDKTNKIKRFQFETSFKNQQECTKHVVEEKDAVI